MLKLTLFLLFQIWAFVHSLGQYTADWESLDSRPLPQWYDDSKIGIFLHWGVYSVPSFESEWFWQNWQGDLARSIRARTDLHFGIYHSLYEWFNPLYLQDKANNFQTNSFVQMKTMPQLYEITNLYSPEVIWSDGEWEAEDWYWNSTVFLAWLFNESPVRDTVVVNDRWGIGGLCTHGSYYTCKDRFNPGVLQTHKWENCMSIDKQSWGYRRNAVVSDYMTIEELLGEIVSTVSCGGNILVNTGPTPDGRIDPIMEERLRQMGQWLSINGEAIYNSSYWIFQNDTLTPGVWYTTSNSSVYASILSWPTKDVVTLGSVTDYEVQTAVTVSLLGFPDSLQATMGPTGLQVAFPQMSQVAGKWAWVLKLDGLTNDLGEK